MAKYSIVKKYEPWSTTFGGGDYKYYVMVQCIFFYIKFWDNIGGSEISESSAIDKLENLKKSKGKKEEVIIKEDEF